MYIVIREYGDYLTGWDKEYGTIAGGSKPMVFPSLDSAKAAARKARRCCMGWNHNKQRVKRARVNFRPLTPYL